tara:strand:+ start:5171 stop:5884 length:714 start_codon:yes stop_codon:yes gene_type:complete
MVTDQRLASQIYNKGKTGTPQDGGKLFLAPEEALYCNVRGDILLSKENIENFSENNLDYIVYKDLKERGLIVKVEDYGLRLYDRNASSKGQSSAIILSKRFEDNIDFTNIFAELDKNLERRVQISIVDSENDAVYYVVKSVFWPKTKLKDSERTITDDEDMRELIDKGYQINSGLKFGTHYRVYNYESKHAPWLIQKIDDSMTWLDVTRMVRVGHGVNKTIVLAYNGKWISFDWIKP